MYLGIIIGNVVLSKMDAPLRGHKLMIVQRINEKKQKVGKPIIAIDTVDSGMGDVVLMVKGKESVGTLPEPHPPSDIGINAIIDDIYVIKELKSETRNPKS